MDILALGLWTHLTLGIALYGTGEYFNCIYPRIEDDYNSVGLVCQWEEEDFYFNAMKNKYTLKAYDSDDNYFESMARKRYWKKRKE